MNPTTKTTLPATGPDRFFVKSMDDYTTHATLDDAIREANDRIQDCLCDGWDEDAVRAVEYGLIMGAAEMFDKHDDPTGEFSYICSYQAAPLKGSMSNLGPVACGSISHGVASWLDVTLLLSMLEIKDPAIKLEVVQAICAIIAAEATQRESK